MFLSGQKRTVRILCTSTYKKQNRAIMPKFHSSRIRDFNFAEVQLVGEQNKYSEFGFLQGSTEYLFCNYCVGCCAYAGVITFSHFMMHTGYMKKYILKIGMDLLTSDQTRFD